MPAPATASAPCPGLPALPPSTISIHLSMPLFPDSWPAVAAAACALHLAHFATHTKPCRSHSFSQALQQHCHSVILSVSLLVSTCQPGCPSMPGAYVPCNTTSGQRQNLSPHIEWWRADACAPPTPSKAHGSAVCAAPHNKASPASPARLNDGHCVCADSHAPLAGKKATHWQPAP